jgi:hypothetical protein
MRKQLAPFQAWLVREIGFEETTARRKAKLAGGALSDYPNEPWRKLDDYEGERCLGVRSPNYRHEIELALEKLAEWIIETAEEPEDGRLAIAGGIIAHLGLDPDELLGRIELRQAVRERAEGRNE